MKQHFFSLILPLAFVTVAQAMPEGTTVVNCERNSNDHVYINPKNIERGATDIALEDGRSIHFYDVDEKTDGSPVRVKYRILRKVPRGALVDEEGSIPYKGKDAIGGVICSYGSFGDFASYLVVGLKQAQQKANLEWRELERRHAESNTK